MSPTTFRAEPTGERKSIDWDDHASIRRVGTGGVFSDFKILHQGTFAEMVRMLAQMGEGERAGLIVEKSGDREFGPGEVMGLYGRPDFPR